MGAGEFGMKIEVYNGSEKTLPNRVVADTAEESLNNLPPLGSLACGSFEIVGYTASPAYHSFWERIFGRPREWDINIELRYNPNK